MATVAVLVALLAASSASFVRESCETGESRCFLNGTGANEKVLEQENKCKIYLAPSSLKGVKGFGVFVTESFKKHDMILPADCPDIPVLDPAWGDRWVEHWDTYWWGKGKGVSDEAGSEADSIADYAPSFSSLPNYHPYLYNLFSKIPDRPYDDTLANRSTNPGAGGFSYHAGRDFMAWDDVDAGDELFLDYGYPDHYEEIEAFSWFKYTPRYEDFETVGDLLEQCWDSLQAVRDMVENNGLQKEIIGHMLSAIRTIAAESSERVASIIPTTMSELDRIAEKSNGEMPALSRAIAEEMTVTKRSINWIIENGRCLDNIVPGPSTLPHAGRGAIAQRFIAAGDIIAPMPLLQIMDAESLINFSDEPDEDGYNRAESVELLINYCFGHSDSSLLLCPLTNAILMNHCSHRSKECGEKGPNAEYRWDLNWDLHTKRWLNMSLDEMAEQFDKGLAFEIVATRDIQAGEEIFFDYGGPWEEAWNHHLATWKPPQGTPYTSVTSLNEKLGPLEIVSGDLRSLPDHATLYTGCLYWDDFGGDDEYPDTQPKWRYTENGNRIYRPLSWEQAFEQNGMSPSDDLWKDLNDDLILLEYGEDGSRFVPEKLDQFERLGDGAHWPCAVISQDSEEEYSVRIIQSELHGDTSWHEDDEPKFLTKYPRRSIRYFLKPYKSDVHLRSAFRSFIEIRDDIFPSHWKNLIEKDDLKEMD